jgi:Tol biopolymer transport system component
LERTEPPVSDLNGTALTALTYGTASGPSFSPQWSPDGTRIVFQSERKLDGSDAINLNGTVNIWRVNADGTGLIALTNATANGASNFSPQWSPDGTRIVFESGLKLDGSDATNANGTSNIWWVRPDGTGLTHLTNATASGAGSSSPEWSPDGSQVVFSSSRKLDGSDAANANGTANIWRVNADGTALSPLTNVTASGATSSSPQHSP